MVNLAHQSFAASDRSYFAILKKEIHKMAVDAGFSESKAGAIDIVVAEITSNLSKHAKDGEILVKVDEEFMEIIGVDSGPGISDISRMMEDGMSTTNTLGHGLGSIRRFSDFFQIYSQKGWGTILLSRIYRTAQAKPATTRAKAEVRALAVCKPGEQQCGDGYFFYTDASSLIVFLGDGLGHGPEAAAAVAEAIKSLKLSGEKDPVQCIRSMNLHVKRTRGLVAAIGIYSFKEKRWRICGVGNIATRIQLFHLVKNYLAYNGIVGMNIPNTMKAQEVDHEHGQVLAMCSDGIRSRWDTSKYPGILKYDLSIMAAAIYKDFGRRTDDMSVLLTRINNG